MFTFNLSLVVNDSQRVDDTEYDPYLQLYSEPETVVLLLYRLYHFFTFLIVSGVFVGKS